MTVFLAILAILLGTALGNLLAYAIYRTVVFFAGDY